MPEPPEPGGYTGNAEQDAATFKAYNHEVMGWQFQQMSEQIYEKALLKDAMGSVIVTNIINPAQNQ